MSTPEERTLARWKDPVNFIEDVLDIKLHLYQAKMIKDHPVDYVQSTLPERIKWFVCNNPRCPNLSSTPYGKSLRPYPNKHPYFMNFDWNGIYQCPICKVEMFIEERIVLQPQLVFHKVKIDDR